jgi:hypothetical protein
MALIRWTAVAAAQKRPNHHLSQITIKRTAAQYSCGRGHGHGTVDTCAYFTINEDTGRTTIPPTNSSAEEERPFFFFFFLDPIYIPRESGDKLRALVSTT